MTEPHEALRITEVSPTYWRATFTNGPLNVFDSAIMIALQGLLDRMEASDELRVVVFDSDVEDFFLAHFDMSGASTEVARAQGPTGLPTGLDITTRLTTSPVISIAKIRGRARGIGSEFALACDLRFASKERAVLGQPEVGAGVIPGGGAIERLSSLVGRGRALEIIVGSDDFDAATAERYGYVNRAVPDAELDEYVDTLARRIASFDRRPIAAAKTLVNRTTLPEVGHLVESQTKFGETLTWPETTARVRELFGRGLQQPGDLETRFGYHLGVPSEEAERA
ncbi:enoyl-CoA hydratase/isomerase family protein [Amycolatopsis sp. NPDC050768]|uniref:enoyl-CoA hydratase/isomerase family protein n=1 Tax=Amycolatopsis sp. NPDC050768 TaxID=3154839 RepID=UPI0033D6A374